MIGGTSNYWLAGHWGMPFTVTAQYSRAGQDCEWIVKRALGNVNYELEGDLGSLRGRFVFREGTPVAETDGSYAIGEFRPESRTPLPITVLLERTNIQRTNAVATAQSLSFGPVSEQVLKSPEGRVAELLDLDTGKHATSTTFGENDRETHAWVRSQRLEVLGVVEKGHVAVLCMDMVAVPAASNGWDAVTAQSVTTNWHLNQTEPNKITPISPATDATDTWFFRTREGGQGVLQILDRTDNPPGVKIRYKLVNVTTSKASTIAPNEAELNARRTLEAAEKEKAARLPEPENVATSPDPVLVALQARLEMELSQLDPRPVFEIPDDHSGSSLYVRFKTREYQIHASSKGGNVSTNTRTEIGPDEGGFELRAHVQPFGQINQAATPQTISRPYWQTYLDVCPVTNTQKQLYIGLSFKNSTDAALLEKLKSILRQVQPETVVAPGADRRQRSTP